MIFETLICREPIEKGWSGDHKYCALDAAGKRFLLRVSDSDRYKQRKAAFERTIRAAKLGIPMPQPLEFGLCNDGVFTIESWINGAEAREIIHTFSVKEQYTYGLDAGKILRKLHSIPAPANSPDWGEFYNRKLDRKIEMYTSCPLKYDGGDAFLRFTEENRQLLENRPLCYQHGDYHLGNMMIDRMGKLIIIDFDKDSYGDPWEEFNRITWSAQASPSFASGLLDGYFDGNIPDKFWNLLKLYICQGALGSLPWAIPFGDMEIRTLKNQGEEILEWYDGMTRLIPSWYR